MRWRIAIFGTLGAVATVVGAMLVFTPDLLLGIQPVGQTIASLSTDPKSVMTAAAAVVGLYVLIATRSPSAGWSLPMDSDAEQRFDAATTDPPEAVTADRRSMTGAGLDADVRVAVASGGEPLRALRDLLRDLAADAYADDFAAGPQETGVDARQAIETGTWTDDSVAAAFLAGDAGPAPSLLSRVRLWLSPERERERRIEATMRAIERLQEER
ncbi:MAG: hypothetical protein V5A45_09255 [Haloarculaceae archaeon]